MLTLQSEALLARPGAWSASEALALLRRGARDPAEVTSERHRALVAWIRRSEPERRVAGDRDVDALYESVRDGRGGEGPFLSGEEALARMGYGTLAALASVWSRTRFLGLGCPWLAGIPRAGQRFLDLGCGSGVDVAIAAALVGPHGAARGIDRLPLLLPASSSRPSEAFTVAESDCIPVPDGWADLVLANGLPPLLTPVSAGPTLQEVSRILAPGGHFRSIAIVSDSAESDTDEDLVAARRSGKPLLRELLASFHAAGLAVHERRVIRSPYRPNHSPRAADAVLLTAGRITE